MWCIIVLCAAVETNYFKKIGRKCYVVVHASNIIYTLSHSLFLPASRAAGLGITIHHHRRRIISHAQCKLQFSL